MQQSSYWAVKILICSSITAPSDFLRTALKDRPQAVYSAKQKGKKGNKKFSLSAKFVLIMQREKRKFPFCNQRTAHFLFFGQQRFALFQQQGKLLWKKVREYLLRKRWVNLFLLFIWYTAEHRDDVCSRWAGKPAEDCVSVMAQAAEVRKENVLLNCILRAKANYPNRIKHRFQHNIRKKCVIQQQTHIQNG